MDDELGAVELSYSREVAVSLLYACYNKFGAEFDQTNLSESILECSTRKVPDTWNSGLFRFLDEAIYLVSITSTLCTTLPLTRPELRAQMILVHQIEMNALAVRQLCLVGLDGPARQNLRALYEMCLALCRSLVDSEFCFEFSQPKDFVAANQFWHKFMSKGGNEKALVEYGKTTPYKCLLVEGKPFETAHQVLGLSAHPSFPVWLGDWGKKIKDPDKLSKMFSEDTGDASEFVLANCCMIIQTTLPFACRILAQNILETDILKANPMFKHHNGDREALDSIGKVAGLMFMMLAKWVNRAKPDFDPVKHL